MNESHGLSPDHQRSVERWLSMAAPDIGPLSRSWLISGGRSNLTYGLEATDGRRYCLRRPPTGNASTHNVVREFGILRDLAESSVPVPRAIAVCSDPAVLGDDFFVMELVPGHTCDTRAAAAALDDAARRRAALAMVEALVAVHSVDLSRSGLANLSRRDGYIQRQLRRWRGQLTDPDVARRPGLVEVHALLQARSPDSEAVSLVHGDFKIGNCLLDASGEVQAVLDWELATLGDPLADVGWLVVSWAAESEDAPRIVDPPSRFGSFPPAEELVDAYAAVSPWALNDLPFYVALAEWRWACIDIGIEKRFRSGQMGDRTIDLDLVDAEIDSRVSRAHGILTGART